SILLKPVCTASTPVGRGTPRQCCARFFPEYNAIPFHVPLERSTRRGTHHTSRKHRHCSCYRHNKSQCRYFFQFASQCPDSHFPRSVCVQYSWEQLRRSNKAPRQWPGMPSQRCSEFSSPTETLSPPFKFRRRDSPKV